MKILNNIRIGSTDYEINFSDEPIILDGKVCYGMIDFDFGTIKLNKSIQGKQKLEKTFLHEVFHGMFKEQNIEIEDEEEIVEKLAISLYQLIRDNQELFK